MLSQRQENFCLNIVSGMTATDAALQAGYGRFSPTHSTAMLKSAKLQQRLNELRKAPVVALIASRDHLGETYTLLFNDKKNQVRDRVAVGKEISQLYGYYAPEKHAILGDIIIEVVYK